MNFDFLQKPPVALSHYNGFTRYEISEQDQKFYNLQMTEWFCDDCGSLTDEDHLDICENCWQ